MMYRTVDARWRVSPILFTLGLRAISFAMMNIVRTIKIAWERAKRTRALKEKLALIPQSQLSGINALPVELWCKVIEHVLDPHMQHKERQCYTLPEILKLRLVCRKSRDNQFKRHAD
jgi:hypothetical protein